jgi:hypothetical protein
MRFSVAHILSPMEARIEKSTTSKKVLQALLDLALKNANHGRRRLSGRNRKSSQSLRSLSGTFNHPGKRLGRAHAKHISDAIVDVFPQRTIRSECIEKGRPRRKLHAADSILSRRSRDGPMEQVSADHSRSVQPGTKRNERIWHSTSIELSVLRNVR